MAMTLNEAQARIAIIHAAISEFHSGKARKSLKIGGHEFNREIINQTVKLDDLYKERDLLQTIIDAWTNANANVLLVKDNVSFPLMVTKGPTQLRNGGY